MKVAEFEGALREHGGGWCDGIRAEARVAVDPDTGEHLPYMLAQAYRYIGDVERPLSGVRVIAYEANLPMFAIEKAGERLVGIVAEELRHGLENLPHDH